MRWPRGSALPRTTRVSPRMTRDLISPAAPPIARQQHQSGALQFRRARVPGTAARTHGFSARAPPRPEPAPGPRHAGVEARPGQQATHATEAVGGPGRWRRAGSCPAYPATLVGARGQASSPRGEQAGVGPARGLQAARQFSRDGRPGAASNSQGVAEFQPIQIAVESGLLPPP